MNNPTHVTLSIDFNIANGETKVTGPLAEKELCVRILARAIDQIVAHNPPVIIQRGHIGNGNGKVQGN